MLRSSPKKTYLFDINKKYKETPNRPLIFWIPNMLGLVIGSIANLPPVNNALNNNNNNHNQCSSNIQSAESIAPERQSIHGLTGCQPIESHNEPINKDNTITHYHEEEQHIGQEGIQPFVAPSNHTGNQGKNIHLQSLSLPLQKKILNQKHIQQLIIVCQSLSLLSSIVYFGLAEGVFQYSYLSDFLVLIGSCLNIISILLRWRFILYFQDTLVELRKLSLSEDNHNNGNVAVVLLVTVRDEIQQIRDIDKLSRSMFLVCFSKIVCPRLLELIKLMNCLLSLLLAIPMYILINPKMSSHKIIGFQDGDSEISVVIILCILSFALQACYCGFYLLAAIGTLIIVVFLFALFGIGAILYYFFIGITLPLRLLFRKICRSRQLNSIIHSHQDHKLKLSTVEIYIKENSKEICFHHLDCKDSLCSICLEEFVDKKTHVQQMLCCKSSFHKKCLQSWVQLNKTCPNCRADHDQLLKQQQQRQIEMKMNQVHRNTIVFAITSTFLHKGLKAFQRGSKKKSDSKARNSKIMANGQHQLQNQRISNIQQQQQELVQEQVVIEEGNDQKN